MGSEPEQVLFSERLWPSPGIWTATAGFGAALGLIPAPIDTGVAVVVGVLGVIGLVTALTVTTPLLILTPAHFRAGRAVVPARFLGPVEVQDDEQMRQARGRGLDARAYLCLRGWLPAGAKVMLTDPDDPTPYWLVSSRRPEALAAAVSDLISRSQEQS